MPEDQPVVITGGSLKINTVRRLTETRNTAGDFEYEYEVSSGKITRVEVDSTPGPSGESSRITIHYEVP